MYQSGEQGLEEKKFDEAPRNNDEKVHDALVPGDEAKEDDEKLDDAKNDEAKEHVENMNDDEGPGNKLNKRVGSQSSVASGGFDNHPKKSKRGKASTWVMEAEFDSLADFDENAVLQDLLDNLTRTARQRTRRGRSSGPFSASGLRRIRGLTVQSNFALL